MEKDPILIFVERLPFFQEFSGDEKSKLVNTQGIFKKYKAGGVIFSEGDSGSSLFVVLTGTIKIVRASNKRKGTGIAQLKAGSVFGEVSLISNRPRGTSAFAASEVVLMQISKKVIESFDLSIQKKFQTQLIQVLAQRLDDMNTKYIKLKDTILLKK